MKKSKLIFPILLLAFVLFPFTANAAKDCDYFQYELQTLKDDKNYISRNYDDCSDHCYSFKDFKDLDSKLEDYCEEVCEKLWKKLQENALRRIREKETRLKRHYAECPGSE